MIYDLSIGFSWPPSVVRELTVDDLVGLGRAADRRDRRSKRKGR
jgi:hypothetical protein